MATLDPINPAGSRRVSGGHVVSRRDLLRAVGLAGLGLAGAHVIGSQSGVKAVFGAADSSAPPASDPLTDLAAALDYDAERIFRFVADEIRYEPYSGILRGARGTLASRAGNSADQAMLLAALLDASLLPVRFAIGEIDAGTADALMASTEADAETIRRHDVGALAGTIPGRTGVPVELTPEHRAQLDEARANGDRIVTWARDQLERTVSAIGSALQGAGIEVLDAFTPLPDTERARHVWVQVAQTSDWRDLDPTLPGAVAGDAAATAAETPDALPEEMAHRVELAVIGETFDGETLSERRLVGYSERAELLAGLPMAVMNVPPDSLTALGVSVAGALEGGVSYVPVIIAGDEAVVGAIPIHLPTGDGASTDGSDGEDLFQSGPGAGETTAQWVELTVRSPDAEPVVVRREILDRLGPARRAAGAISPEALAPVGRVDLPDGTDAQALPALTTHWLSVRTGLPARDDPVMSVAPDLDVADRAIISHAYHLLSTAAGAEVAVPAGYRTFADKPNVMAHSLVARPSADGDLALDAVLDIWHRSYGVTPVAGVTSGSRPNVSAGVLAHVVERIMNGEAADTGPGAADVASAGAVFDAAETRGIPWRVLRGAGATSEMPWSDDARARLEKALAQGWTAIAPERAVDIGQRERVGWWLVDPGTGRTVDQLDDGRGSSTTDTTIVASSVSLRNIAAYQRLGLCIAGLMSLIAEFMSLILLQAELASAATDPSVAVSAGGLSGVFGLAAFGLLHAGAC